MSQPPNNPGQDPQWGPQHTGPDPLQRPNAQPQQGPVGPDGQPYQGPVGPDDQPYQGPIGPDDQPYQGPTGPDGQPYQGPIGPDGQPQPGVASDAPGASKPNGFSAKQLVGALVALAVLATAGFFVWQNFQKDAALAVGNCLVITGEVDDADHELADCDDQSTLSYYVGEVIEGDGACSDEYATPYSITEESGGDKQVTKVACLVPQLFEGTCYAESDGIMDLQPADCSEAVIKVTKVTDETGSQCEADENQLPLTHPARTYCIAEVQ